MKQKIEKYYPIFLSVLIIVAMVVCKQVINGIPDMVDKLSDQALSISVTFLGFLLTILTIINSIETRRMHFVKSAGKYADLISYLKVSIQTNLALIGLSFITKFFEHRSVLWLSIMGFNFIDYLYIFFFVFTILVSYRFTKIFVTLLTDPK